MCNKSSRGYTIGLVRIKDDPRHDNLLGSGTLVSLGGSCAILTAHHVVAELSKATKFGLCISDNAHRMIWEKQHSQIIDVGQPCHSQRNAGPDIALIKLLGAKLGTLKARKSFYDLSHMVKQDVDYGAGLFVGGFVGEMTREGGPEGCFQGTKAFCMLTGGVGAVEKYWERNDFDFCSFATKLDCDDNPRYYSGLSGGGLWKVIATKIDANTYRVKDTILCGVAYWQTLINSNESKIICHGHRSIYGPVRKALSKSTKRE